ncbi:SelT/SelW/SelH family protein [Nitrococcus mobilis]|nr:SelT/SelW/SelH family protein [Nitrococcus mobilis]
METMSNKVEIRYCTQCRWLLRSAWMAQELLTTFEQEIAELTLQPVTGGVFDVYANGKLVWSRKKAGRFPEITELKQLVRDQIAPGKGLGHADRKGSQSIAQPLPTTHEPVSVVPALFSAYSVRPGGQMQGAVAVGVVALPQASATPQMAA